MHRRRLISALIAVPVLCLALFNQPLGLPLSLVLVSSLCLLATREALALFVPPNMGFQAWPTYAAALLAPVLVFFWPNQALPILALFFPLVCCVQLYAPPEQATRGLAVHALVYLYLVIPFAALIYLRCDEAVGMKLLQWLLVVSIFTDVGGYYGGKIFGRHRIAPVLSPNKTLEGSIGGVVLSVAAGLVFFYFIADRPEFAAQGLVVKRDAAQPFWYEFHWFQLVVLTAALSLLCQVGDAVESLFKRGAGVKDSGVNVTGHGGILDRIDGLIFAAPLVAVYAVYIHYSLT